MIEPNSIANKLELIKSSNLTIYDVLEPGDPRRLTGPELESVLSTALIGMDLSGLALRTRSKTVKAAVVNALGYPVPRSFMKVQPKFPCQDFDVYVQKSNNLQVWNEELTASRRYVIVIVNSENLIAGCKVITGAMLADYDTTGKLTHKYQARLSSVPQGGELFSPIDNDHIRELIADEPTLSLNGFSPSEPPVIGCVLPIRNLFQKLKPIIGKVFVDPGVDQERLRGESLHRLVAGELGYSKYSDGGQFPDILNQLIEVKLQMAPTIDLGLVTPSSTTGLDINPTSGVTVRHCDVRYAVFSATTENEIVTIKNLLLIKGSDFFKKCPRLEGNVVNKKLQIRLPSSMFARTRNTL